MGVVYISVNEWGGEGGGRGGGGGGGDYDIDSWEGLSATLCCTDCRDSFRDSLYVLSLCSRFN